MHAMDLESHLTAAVDAVQAWQREWGPFDHSDALRVDDERFREALETYVERLRGNYPFFHPRYAGQMLKPPHAAAVVGYAAAMLINPNNHALDGGPPTSAMEKEVVAALAAMFGFPKDSLGHLTSSGTIANLEALWVARETHPDRGIAVSDQAHYTHERMSGVVRMDVERVPAGADGRVDLERLEDAVRSGRVGTVVLTAGTTGLGAVDPIADVLPWRERYGIRIHVDAAYGGFFTLLSEKGPAEAEVDPRSPRCEEVDTRSPLDEETRRHLRAITECDSVVIDPHKHGLQPYGCGCVLFRDPEVGRFYLHDSAYTYFTSDDLHLGEISLECSRAGAAAGALWLTLQILPLTSTGGLGDVLKAGLRAARAWHGRLAESDVLEPYIRPELDILTYFPRSADVDAASQALFGAAMNDADDPVFLSVLRLPAEWMRSRGHASKGEWVRVLRSVLMKPEHEMAIEHLHERVEHFARLTGRAAEASLR